MTSFRNAIKILVTFSFAQIAFEKRTVEEIKANSTNKSFVTTVVANGNNNHITDRNILADHHDVDIDEEMALLSIPKQEEFLKRMQYEMISLDDSYNDIDIDGTEEDDDTIATDETGVSHEITATAIPWYAPYLTPSQPMDLPLLEWEIASSSSNRVCNPPGNIPTSCCLGSTSKGGAIKFFNNKCNHPIENHYKLANYTIDYLNNNIQYEESTATTPNVITSNVTVSKQRTLLRQRNRQLRSGNSDALNNKLILPKQDCDICRIIDYLIIFNWTLAMQGDSMSRQSFNGLECELRRRGYNVQSNTTEVYSQQPKQYYWQYGIREITTVFVSWPKSDETDILNNNNETEILPEQFHSAKLVLYYMYRPAADNKEIDEVIIKNSDIVVFDHGVHYKPHEQDSYVQGMTNLLRAYKQNRTNLDKQLDHINHPLANHSDVYNNTTTTLETHDNDTSQQHRLKLVAWRQTTSQHFNSTGGHFLDRVKGFDKRTCMLHPKPDGPNDEGFRLHLMRQAADAANYTILNVFDPQFATKGKTKNQDELILLPYRDYTSPLYYLHPNECTHYCNNPYLWLPMWRTLRIAVERTVRLHQIEQNEKESRKKRQ